MSFVKPLRLLQLAPFFFLATHFSHADVSALPSTYLTKVETTPDLRQSLPDAKLPFGGVPYCGPVAVSNSMVWLSRNGFERLAPVDVAKPGVQVNASGFSATSWRCL